MKKISNAYNSSKLTGNKVKSHSVQRSSVVSALVPMLLGLPASLYAQSTVGTFSSVVTIQGPVNQTATGSNVQQNLNVGSAEKSKTNSFSSVVTTGAITQTGQNGAQQFINVGGMNNSQANKFDANVNVGRIEQVGNSGERQELDIGSVTNSTVRGTATTRVEVTKGVKQTGNGEIVLGSVKNSNVGQFESNLSVRGKIEGNNIRMGSVVSQERYDNKERYVGTELPVSNAPSSLTLNNFSSSNRKEPFTGDVSVPLPATNLPVVQSFSTADSCWIDQIKACESSDIPVQCYESVIVKPCRNPVASAYSAVLGADKKVGTFNNPSLVLNGAFGKPGELSYVEKLDLKQKSSDRLFDSYIDASIDSDELQRGIIRKKNEIRRVNDVFESSVAMKYARAFEGKLDAPIKFIAEHNREMAVLELELNDYVGSLAKISDFKKSKGPELMGELRDVAKMAKIAKKLKIIDGIGMALDGIQMAAAAHGIGQDLAMNKNPSANVEKLGGVALAAAGPQAPYFAALQAGAALGELIEGDMSDTLKMQVQSVKNSVDVLLSSIDVVNKLVAIGQMDKAEKVIKIIESHREDVIYSSDQLVRDLNENPQTWIAAFATSNMYNKGVATDRIIEMTRLLKSDDFDKLIGAKIVEGMLFGDG